MLAMRERVLRQQSRNLRIDWPGGLDRGWQLVAACGRIAADLTTLVKMLQGVNRGRRRRRGGRHHMHAHAHAHARPRTLTQVSALA
eukprot:349932-Chlamydomonas_euryale.AAC.9